MTIDSARGIPRSSRLSDRGERDRVFDDWRQLATETHLRDHEPKFAGNRLVTFARVCSDRRNETPQQRVHDKRYSIPATGP